MKMWLQVLLTVLITLALFFSVDRFSGNGHPDTGGQLVLAHDKGIIPMFQSIFACQGQAAEEALGTGFVPISSQTTDLFVSRMMAALPTREAPELFTWWSTARVKTLVDKGLVEDLTDLWDRHGKNYDRAIRDAYTFNGRVYGFPYSIEYWAVWYNKEIFTRLNLQEPRSWAEFMAVCATLKAHGIPPLLSSLQDQWYAFVWFMQLVIGQDPDFYVDLCRGKASYLDPRAQKAMAVWKDMIEKGYFTDPGANMFTNGGHLWNKEKFAMILCGSWYYSTVLIPQEVNEETIGVFILPSHNQGAGKNIAMETGPIFTAVHSPRNQEARKIADWWMGSEGNLHFSRLLKSYSPNREADPSYLPRAKQKLLSRIYDEQYRILNRYWEASPTPICEFAVNKLGVFILDPTVAGQVLSEIDRFSQDYFASTPQPQPDIVHEN